MFLTTEFALLLGIGFVAQLVDGALGMAYGVLANTAMLSMGLSKPWPDALQAFTGTREMSAKPMLEYFAPLQAWLEKQNAGKQCGW